MIRVGITGQAGFVGTHLFNYWGLHPDTVERIAFEDNYFSDESLLRNFVKQCDVIVHLAAMNRHPDPEVIYNTNVKLVQKLIDALVMENVSPHVMFSSSTQEELDNLYGKSKLEGRRLLEVWAEENEASFTGLVVPNVFGEFSKPNYNTFIATFAYKIINGEQPQIINDSDVKLIHVSSLCNFIIENVKGEGIRKIEVPFDFERKVSEILNLFEQFKMMYFEKGYIPSLNNKDDINLFNTFRSYIDYASTFPIKLHLHSDNRGYFSEIIRAQSGGQISFSSTYPGVTRGNHYHTRKIERFTVIKGKAKIQLRKIGTDEIFDFYLNGNEPAYVDMPVWYTHNITNIGEDELITQFWINEWYNPEDTDTYFEEV